MQPFKRSFSRWEPLNFVSLSLLTILVTYASGELLDFEQLFSNSLAEQMTAGQVEDLLNVRNKWEWLAYVVIPLMLLIKVSVIAFVLDVGLFFFSKKIAYKKLFGMVVRAEFVFLLVVIIKTIWFSLIQTDFILDDLQYYYPLSMLNLIGHEEIEAWFIYPFQLLNLFQVAYWFILAWMLGRELKSDLGSGLKIVLSSYGTGLLIWVVAMMFLTLNMS